MIFQDEGGKEVVLRGVNTYLKKVVTTHSMGYIIMHGDIEWDVECRITTEGTYVNVSYKPKDIKNMFFFNKNG